jgi:hypothetical protein
MTWGMCARYPRALSAGSNLSSGAIAGIVIAVVVVAAIGGFMAFRRLSADKVKPTATSSSAAAAATGSGSAAAHGDVATLTV